MDNDVLYCSNIGNLRDRGPARVAQWGACRTHDLVVVSSPVEAKFLSGVFTPLTSAEGCEKSS